MIYLANTSKDLAPVHERIAFLLILMQAEKHALNNNITS